MADIVLKDRNGKNVTYSGIETVTFDTPTDGEQATFTHGVEQVGKEVELDFSGDAVETEIFTEQTLEGFEQDDVYGAYVYNVTPSPFTLILGETYKVAWGETVWECTAQDMSAFIAGAIAVGNLSNFGGTGNGEPFVIGWTESGVSFFAFEDPGSIAVCVYHVAEGTPMDMVVQADEGYLLKSLTIKKPDDLAPENIRNGFTVGGISGSFIGDTEEQTVPLAMADGDMVIEPSASGKVLSKVVIQKPETLLPENIAKDVEIAGVVGEFAGGVQLEGDILKYIAYQLADENKEIIIYAILWDELYATTGSYDVNIPDTIGEYQVVIVAKGVA